MGGFSQVPEWFGTAVLGAVIAAVGYVSKLFLDWIGEIFARARNRRAKLVEALSLLRAGQAAYEVQCEHRNRLYESVLKRTSGNAESSSGYERVLTAAFPSMTDDEKELHTIIRTITTNTLSPLNESLLQWLREDTYFKAKTWGKGLRAKVAKKLAILDSHLLLWRAKYAVWIPDNPAHALVYLVDEQKHGVGFPQGIEADVENLLTKRWWIGG
jgi:hypothetical protein